MRFSSTILPLTLASLAYASPSRQDQELAPRTSGPTCTTFKVPITANAQNKAFNIPASYDLSQGVGPILNSVLAGVETALGNLLGGLILTSGTYNINMKYCEPEVTVASRAKTIQVSCPNAVHLHTFFC